MVKLAAYLYGDLWSFLVGLLGRMSETELKFGSCKFSLKVFRSAARFVFVFRECSNILREIVLSHCHIIIKCIQWKISNLESLGIFKQCRKSIKFKIQINKFGFHFCLLYYTIFMAWHMECKIIHLLYSMKIIHQNHFSPFTELLAATAKSSQNQTQLTCHGEISSH